MDSSSRDKLYLSLSLWNGDSLGSEPAYLCLHLAKLEPGVYPECGPGEPLTASCLSCQSTYAHRLGHSIQSCVAAETGGHTCSPSYSPDVTEAKGS